MTRALLLCALLSTICCGYAAASEARAPGTECLGVAATQEALRSGEARRWTEIRPHLAGEIVRTDLCREGTRLLYRVMLLDDRGRVRPMLIDAATGGLVYDGR